MSKIDIESYKSLVGQQALLGDDGIGVIVGISEDGEALIQKYLDMEGLEETDETVLISVDEVKLRTFVVMEKVDEGMTEGAIVSWETSNGAYYGDIMSSSTEGTVRGEPQGLEIEGSAERPAYVVRVWMWDEDEWMPTNVTVVAYGDALSMIEELPQPMDEEDPEDEDMPEDEMSMVEDNEKSIDMNIEAQIAEIVAREVAKALAAMNNAEVKSEEVVVETKSDEAAEAVAEEVVAEEAAAEAPAEEVVAEEAAPEAAPAEEVVAEEKSGEAVIETAELSFDDLKEFHDLIKVLQYPQAPWGVHGGQVDFAAECLKLQGDKTITKVDALIYSLSDEDKKSLLDALNDLNISTRTISQVLKNNGHRVGRNAIDTWRHEHVEGYYKRSTHYRGE